MKLKYGFSMQGWARRALDLEIIDAGQYKALCVMFSRNHWEGLISKERAEQICPGCTSEDDLFESERAYSPTDLRRLPKDQRDSILKAAAEQVADVYTTDRDLTDFEAFGQEDLYVDSAES